MDGWSCANNIYYDSVHDAALICIGLHDSTTLVCNVKNIPFIIIHQQLIAT
jgi:hypothetical protein